MSTFLTDPRGNAAYLADLLAAVEGDDLPPDRRAAVRAAIIEARSSLPVVTWASPRPGEHVIDGEHVDSALVGLTAAHLAFMWPWRKVVRAADLAAPGAAHPDDVVRKALKTAAHYIGPLNPRAAAAVRLVRVVDGHVTFAPDGRFEVRAS
jgi:hypothetical protein